MTQARREMQFHIRYAKWYELDWFIVMREERHGFVKGMWTTEEGDLLNSVKRHPLFQY